MHRVLQLLRILAEHFHKLGVLERLFEASGLLAGHVELLEHLCCIPRGHRFVLAAHGAGYFVAVGYGTIVVLVV